MEPIRLAEMLDGLGPGASSIVAVSRLGDDTWLVAFDDEMTMAIEMAEAPDRFVFTSPIGRPPGNRRTAVLETLLSFNSLWQDHLGTWLAMNGPDGELLAIQELAADILTPAGMQDQVLAHAAIARELRSYVVAEPKFSHTSETDLFNPLIEPV